MSSTTRKPLAIATLVLALGGTAAAQSNIDPANSYAWGENIGWVNLYPSATNGVVVTGDYLSGYAWGENVGWIFFGDGPDDGIAYTNTGTDHGVNNDGAGNLSGYAWGENIGWILFDTTVVGASQVTVDMTSGDFNGYAWGANVGWIDFGTNTSVSFLPSTGVGAWSLYD